MASFYDTTVGQHVEFQRVLASAGFTNTDIARINKEPQLALAMYESIQPKVTTTPPWYVLPEQQLEYASELWPDAILPEPPEEFVPLTSSEVLLLHVPDSFDSLWEKVVVPAGYSKERQPTVRSDSRYLRLAPNKREYKEPVWLAFDPEHGLGGEFITPASLWGQSNLAASEVFSALIQFPEWPFSWSSDGTSSPNLSGYQASNGQGEWINAPYVSRNNEQGGIVWLGEYLAGDWGYTGNDGSDTDKSSPTVREC